MSEQHSHPERMELLKLTTEIVVARVANYQVPAETLPQLIHDVYKALTGDKLSENREGNGEKQIPAVPIRKSVFPDYIICLEDGKKLKMLKRHLKSNYNMTPDQYRAKWGLPPDYPVVAPNYAERRSNLAREIGLGRITPLEKQEEN